MITPLLSLGLDAKGVEQFWISSYNSNVGCLGVKMSEKGEARVYRFFKPRCPGFYSAVAENARILWLWGTLDRVVRLNLDTGHRQPFFTGASGALVFQGMVRDERTGKLLAIAFPPPHTEAVIFDTAQRKSVRRLSDFSCQHHMRFSFPNGDGTHTLVLQCPGLDFVRWDPRDDSLKVRTVAECLDTYKEGPLTYRMIPDDQGRRYVPGHGWFHPKLWRFERGGPRPEREMTWFARQGRWVYGGQPQGNGGILVCRWSMANGGVAPVGEIPDSGLFGVGLARSGKLVSVNTYGFFRRLDARTGVVEICRRLPVDSVGHVDCLVRLDEQRLLGTPFISQRFWEVNVKTKQGRDRGRAAPGMGQITHARKLGGKVYMAAYTGGELVEYDPALPGYFPENPRVVADAPGGMRPNALVDDGRTLFYACSREYGRLGSVISSYDTRTGETRHREDPVPDEMILTLAHDRVTGLLVWGSTIHADGQTFPPRSKRCHFGLLDPVSLTVRSRVAAPKGTAFAEVCGPMGGGRYLCVCHGPFPEGHPWFVLDARALREPDLAAMRRLPSACRAWRALRPTGKPGYFLQRIEGRVELWDMRGDTKRVDVLNKGIGEVRNCFAAENDVYLMMPKRIVILKDFLKGLR